MRLPACWIAGGLGAPPAGLHHASRPLRAHKLPAAAAPAVWSAGPAVARADGAARVAFAPNTTEVQRLMLLLAKAAACPPEAAAPRRNSSTSFYRFWAAGAAEAAAAHPECAGAAAACRAQPTCYLPLFRRQLAGYATGEEAAAAAAAAPGTVDAVLDFTAWQQGRQAPAERSPPGQRPGLEQQQAPLGHGGQALGPAPSHAFAYTLRMNHSEVPPTRMRLNQVRLAGCPAAAAAAGFAKRRCVQPPALFGRLTMNLPAWLPAHPSPAPPLPPPCSAV